MKYKWIIREPKQFENDFLEVAFGSEVVANLLLNRGINSTSKAKSYLYPKYYKESLPDEIPDLAKARDRILKSIERGEKIVIFGDYDVDGITATSCLLLTLRQFTNNVDFYIPSRLTEGYGLNIKAVEIMKDKFKVNLLITCDCGISNHKEIEFANSLGIDVIVTDHHSLPATFPPAYAVLNPKLLPGDHKMHFLPGVGVAYKLAEAILREKNDNIQAGDLLDLVTLGMIADIVPLVGENRYLVQTGLPRLANTKKVGLKELLRVCVSPSILNTDHVGFGIAPRINAIGRLADAALAVKLLTTNDLPEAVQIATELDFQNKQRQLLCEETLNEAVEMIEEQGLGVSSNKCIVLAKEGWHHGVLGIVASKIVEKYFLPTILLTIDKDQDIVKGSGRSIEQLNITEALEKSSFYLEKYGGHKAACGLSLRPEKLNDFTFYFKQVVSEMLQNADIEPTLKIDLEIQFSELGYKLVDDINKLSPFGLGNPLPVFVSNEVEVVNVKTIGKDSKHLKLFLKPETNLKNKFFEALIWNHNRSVHFNIRDKLKIAYTPKLNSYNGETSIQLEVRDWEITGVRGQEIEVRNKKLEIREKEEHIFELFDFRNRTQECLEFLKKTQVVYFAETEQKNFLPLKTFSRNKITKAENLVFLESPPNENVLSEVIKISDATRIYLAFPFPLPLTPHHFLKRLIGMLKYTITNKNSRVNELELQSALGINRSTLAYALETLVKSEFLKYERLEVKTSGSDLLNIKILPPSRQNFEELIEYNLFVSELQKVIFFREWMYSANANELLNKLTETYVKSEIVTLRKEEIVPF